MGMCSALSRLSAVVNPTIWASLLNLGVDVAIFTGAGMLFLGLIIIFFMPKDVKHDLEDHIKAA